MSIQVFGITSSTVRSDYFPNFPTDFSATTTPSAARVTEWVRQESADLAGRLRLKALSAAAIVGDVTSEAYAWCQKTVTLGVAVRVARVTTASNPEYAKGLKDELDARYELLEKHGAEALGLGVTVADDTPEPEGPTSHIDDLGLDTGENDGNTSDVVPVLRRNDQL